MALLLMLVSGALGGLIGYDVAASKCIQSNSNVPDTTWFTITETKYIPSPPDTVMVVKYKTVQVPVAAVNIDSTADSARVTLPFEQHLTHIAGIADVWHSGYKSMIDSVRAYETTTVKVVEKPYPVYKMPLVTAELGCAALHRGETIAPYLVGGASLNMTRTNLSVFGAWGYGEYGVGVKLTYRFDIIR